MPKTKPAPSLETSPATFDLKAVNPRARDERDARSSEEILESMATQGATVAEALAKLREALIPVRSME
jgi:hypothetical protein